MRAMKVIAIPPANPPEHRSRTAGRLPAKRRKKNGVGEKKGAARRSEGEPDDSRLKGSGDLASWEQVPGLGGLNGPGGAGQKLCVQRAGRLRPREGARGSSERPRNPSTASEESPRPSVVRPSKGRLPSGQTPGQRRPAEKKGVPVKGGRSRPTNDKPSVSSASAQDRHVGSTLPQKRPLTRAVRKRGPKWRSRRLVRWAKSPAREGRGREIASQRQKMPGEVATSTTRIIARPGKGLELGKGGTRGGSPPRL